MAMSVGLTIGGEDWLPGAFSVIPSLAGKVKFSLNRHFLIVARLYTELGSTANLIQVARRNSTNLKASIGRKHIGMAVDLTLGFVRDARFDSIRYIIVFFFVELGGQSNLQLPFFVQCARLFLGFLPVVIALGVILIFSPFAALAEIAAILIGLPV